MASTWIGYTPNLGMDIYNIKSVASDDVSGEDLLASIINSSNSNTTKLDVFAGNTSMKPPWATEDNIGVFDNARGVIDSGKSFTDTISSASTADDVPTAQAVYNYFVAAQLAHTDYQGMFDYFGSKLEVDNCDAGAGDKAIIYLGSQSNVAGVQRGDFNGTSWSYANVMPPEINGMWIFAKHILGEPDEPFGLVVYKHDSINPPAFDAAPFPMFKADESDITFDSSGAFTLTEVGTPGTKGESANKTLDYGDTFKVLQTTVDAKGRMTSVAERTMTMPDESGTEVITLTKVQLAALENPPNSGLYPDLVGKIVIVSDEEFDKTELGSFVHTFTAGSWAYDSVNNIYYISIPENVHNLGEYYALNLWILNNGKYIQATNFPSSRLWSSVDGGGNLTLYSEVTFPGRIVAIGEGEGSGSSPHGASESPWVTFATHDIPEVIMNPGSSYSLGNETFFDKNAFRTYHPDKNYVIRHAYMIMCAPFLQIRNYNFSKVYNLRDLFPGLLGDPANDNEGNPSCFANFTIVTDGKNTASSPDNYFIKIIGPAGLTHILDVGGTEDNKFYIYNPTSYNGAFAAYEILLGRINTYSIEL